MASSMARVYASACEREENSKNFNTVPAKIKDEVRSIIESIPSLYKCQRIFFCIEFNCLFGFLVSHLYRPHSTFQLRSLKNMLHSSPPFVLGLVVFSVL